MFSERKSTINLGTTSLAQFAGDTICYGQNPLLADAIEYGYIANPHSTNVLDNAPKCALALCNASDGIPIENSGLLSGLKIETIGVFLPKIENDENCLILGDFAYLNQDSLFPVGGNSLISELPRKVQHLLPGRLNALNNQLVECSEVNIYQSAEAVFRYFSEKGEPADLLDSKVALALVDLLGITSAESGFIVKKLLDLRLRNIRPEIGEEMCAFIDRQLEYCKNANAVENVLFPSEIAQIYGLDSSAGAKSVRESYETALVTQNLWSDFGPLFAQRRYYDQQTAVFDQEGVDLQGYIVDVCTKFDMGQLHFSEFPSIQTIAQHFGCHKRKVQEYVHGNAVVWDIFQKVRHQTRIQGGVLGAEVARHEAFEYKGIKYASADEALVSELFTRYLGYTAVDGVTFQVSPDEIVARMDSKNLHITAPHKFDFNLINGELSHLVEYRDVHWLAVNNGFSENDPDYESKIAEAKANYITRRQELLCGVPNTMCTCLFSVAEVINFIEQQAQYDIIDRAEIQKFVTYWQNLRINAPQVTRTKRNTLLNRLGEFFLQPKLALEI